MLLIPTVKQKFEHSIPLKDVPGQGADSGIPTQKKDISISL